MFGTIKVNDHLMDALRYGVRTMRLVKPKEEYKSPFFLNRGGDGVADVAGFPDGRG